jgi:hypothetical protein
MHLFDLDLERLDARAELIAASIGRSFGNHGRRVPSPPAV